MSNWNFLTLLFIRKNFLVLDANKVAKTKCWWLQNVHHCFFANAKLFFVVVRTEPMVMIFIFVNHLYYVSREFLVLKVLREDMVKKGIRYCITRDNSFPSILTKIVLLLAVTLLFKFVLYLLGTTFNSK